MKNFNAKRRDLARVYFRLFERNGLAELGRGMPVRDWENTNWHRFQVMLPEARLTIPGLRGDGPACTLKELDTGVHYPVIHRFALYRKMGWKDGDFPNAEYAGRNILTLAALSGHVDR